jgi:hypothetical protein
MTEDHLESDLIEAGRTLRIEPVPDDLATEVLNALAPVRLGSRRRSPSWWRWLRARRRRLVAALVIGVLLLVSALTPSVRAAVSEWLRIGGVVIRTGAPPLPSGAPSAGPPTGVSSPPPVSGRVVTLEQARASVDFPVGVPSALGAPARVTVSDDRRVVGMDWTVGGRPVHLDQFDGTVSWVFLKQNWSIVTPTEVDGADAAWLADPHEIVYVDRAGVERRETARVSGPCLVWQPTLGLRLTTARLEGVAPLADARKIAESLR